MWNKIYLYKKTNVYLFNLPAHSIVTLPNYFFAVWGVKCAKMLTLTALIYINTIYLSVTTSNSTWPSSLMYEW